MIGRTISHYKILAKLGEGGMGVVYLAEDLDLHRQIALKFLPAEMAADPSRLERFRREAKAVASLNHPSIVTLYSIEEDDGRHFLTMELIEGETLDELIVADGLSLSRIFPIVIALADALSTAHERGIVHRDLKPANIMVTKEGRVKMLDFGLAKFSAEHESHQVSDDQTDFMTQVGAFMGTAPYMSPEQIKGIEVDHRSDIFSLGIILYEMATGSRPFGGESSADLVSAILRDAPPEVSEVQGELPREFGRIVNRCLVKDLDERYQTAKDIYHDIRALKQEISTMEIRLGVEPEPGPANRRRPLYLAAGAAVVLLLVALAYFAPRPASPPTSSYAVAVMPFENLTGDPDKDYVATGIGSGLITSLSEVTGLRVVSRAEAWSASNQSSSSTALAKRLGVNALIEGEVQRQKDLLLVGVRVTDGSTGRVLWSESFDKQAEEVFALQNEIANKLASVFSIPLSGRERRRLAQDPTRSFRAYDHYLKAQEYLEDPDDPDEVYQAVELFRQAIRVDSEFALAHAGLAEALWNAYRLNQDQPALREAETEAERALELDPKLPAAQMALARVYRSTGRLDESIAEMEEVLGDHPKPAEAQRELAYIYERVGDFEAAERCLRVSTAMAGDDWFNWNWLGTFLARSGHYEEASGAFEKATSVAPPDVYLPRENLATIDLSMGRFEEALQAFERLPEEMTQARPRLASNIGTAYYFSDRPNRFERAAEYYRLAVRLRSKYALYHGNLGDAYEKLGRQDDALKEYRLALSLTETELEEDPEDSELRLEQAHYAAKAQDCPQALALVDDLEGTLSVSGPSFLRLGYVFSQCDREEEALEAIRLAVDLGESTEAIRQAPELENLRGTPGFEDLVAGAPPAAPHS